MPITLVNKQQRREQEESDVSTGKITVQLKNRAADEVGEKYAVIIANLPAHLGYKEFKQEVFPDFEAMYYKFADGVYFAYLGSRLDVMRFCKKYNLATVDKQEIRCAPVIKLEQENVVSIRLKQ